MQICWNNTLCTCQTFLSFASPLMLIAKCMFAYFIRRSDMRIENYNYDSLLQFIVALYEINHILKELKYATHKSSTRRFF